VNSKPFKIAQGTTSIEYDTHCAEQCGSWLANDDRSQYTERCGSWLASDDRSQYTERCGSWLASDDRSQYTERCGSWLASDDGLPVTTFLSVHTDALSHQ